MINKEPTIYKQGESNSEIIYTEKVFKKQSKYTQINGGTIRMRYSTQSKIAYITGWFSVSSTLTPNYSSSDVGGTPYWPALFYIDDLDDDFWNAFDTEGSPSIAIYADGSNFFSVQLLIDKAARIVDCRFSPSKSISTTTTTVNIIPSVFLQ